MLCLIGLGAVSGQRDLLAAMDRRQSTVLLPKDVSPVDYALQKACSPTGATPTQTLRCGPDDAAICLGALLHNWPEPHETIALLEQFGDGVLVLLLALPQPGVAALACISTAASEHYEAAELVQLSSPAPEIWNHFEARPAGAKLAVVALAETLPSLTGLAQLAVCVHGRRIPAATSTLLPRLLHDPRLDWPVWSRFWPPPQGGGRRTGLAVLPDGSVLAVTQAPKPIAQRITGADVAPHVFAFAAVDAAGLAERIAAPDGVPAWPDMNALRPCRAALLVDSPADRARAARALFAKLSVPTAPAQFVDSASGSSFVTEPFGPAPVGLVFSGFGSGHPGMLRRLTDALPPLADYLETTFGDGLHRLMPVTTLYPPATDKTNTAQLLQGEPEAIAGAEVLIHAVYGWLAREVLALRPAACIGVSLGALAMAPVLCGQPEAIAKVLCGTNGLVDSVAKLVGDATITADDNQWAHAWVGGPAEALLAALRGFRELHLLVQCDNRMLLLGGKHGDIQRFLRATRAVGRITSSGLRYLHTPMIGAAVAGVQDALSHAASALPRARLRGIDFYVSDRPIRAGASTEAMSQWCRQVRESLLLPVDFPGTIRAAYRRGIRIFVVCSARDDMVDWIGRILGGLPHLAVALGCTRLDPWRALLSAACLLRAHGVFAADTPLDQIMRMPA